MIPTRLSKELAYLAGMVNGDGNLTKYILRIVDYSIKNIQQLQNMFVEHFDITGNILTKRENSPEIIITNLWVVRLFSFLTSQPIGGKKYHSLREPLIFRNNPLFRSYYWSGVMDADGSYKNRRIVFVSTSLDYSKDFKDFLIFHKIDSNLTERKDATVSIYIPSRFHTRITNLLVSIHPDKSKDFNKLLSVNSRTNTYFAGFKNESLINHYFNLRLIDNLSVTGLGHSIRSFRGSRSRIKLASNLSINYKTIEYIENGRMSINILLLEKILQMKNIRLMPFLTEQSPHTRYHIRSSERVRLATQHTEELILLLEPLTFYKNRIKVPDNLIKKIESYFQIEIQDNNITNKLLLKFFSIFCDTMLIKNK